MSGSRKNRSFKNEKGTPVSREQGGESLEKMSECDSVKNELEKLRNELGILLKRIDSISLLKSNLELRGGRLQTGGQRLEEYKVSNGQRLEELSNEITRLNEEKGKLENKLKELRISRCNLRKQSEKLSQIKGSQRISSISSDNKQARNERNINGIMAATENLKFEIYILEDKHEFFSNMKRAGGKFSSVEIGEAKNKLNEIFSCLGQKLSEKDEERKKLDKEIEKIKGENNQLVTELEKIIKEQKDECEKLISKFEELKLENKKTIESTRKNNKKKENNMELKIEEMRRVFKEQEEQKRKEVEKMRESNKKVENDKFQKDVKTSTLFECKEDRGGKEMDDLYCKNTINGY